MYKSKTNNPVLTLPGRDSPLKKYTHPSQLQNSRQTKKRLQITALHSLFFIYLTYNIKRCVLTFYSRCSLIFSEKKENSIDCFSIFSLNSKQVPHLGSEAIILLNTCACCLKHVGRKNGKNKFNKFIVPTTKS